MMCVLNDIIHVYFMGYQALQSYCSCIRILLFFMYINMYFFTNCIIIFFIVGICQPNLDCIPCRMVHDW